MRECIFAQDIVATSTFDALNKLLSISILIAFLFQAGVKTGVMLWYQANKAYIGKELCENRDRPQLHCDGKCILAKKLKKAESEEERNAIPVGSIRNEIAPCILNLERPVSTVTGASKRIFGHYRPSYSFQFHTNIFHPPPVV